MLRFDPLPPQGSSGARHTAQVSSGAGAAGSLVSGGGRGNPSQCFAGHHLPPGTPTKLEQGEALECDLEFELVINFEVETEWSGVLVDD